MKLEDYKLIMQLNQYHTIRATARNILISQPAITQRLKYIEEYLGVDVFIRTSKGLVLTPAGETVLKHARAMLSSETELHNQLLRSKETVSGTLSLGASSLISQHHLPYILQKYTTASPDVKIDLVTGTSAEIKQAAGDYHVSIVRGEPIKGYVNHALFKDALYLFDTVSLNGTAERPFIEFKTDAEYQRLVEEWMLQQNKIKIRRTMKVDHFETAKQLMRTGLGVTVLPESIVEEELWKLPHLPLQLNGRSMKRRTWVCFNKELSDLPQVAAFIKLLLNHSWEGV
ncbi:LysR family transcriptional regulator [Halobacillus sp. A5]|uniref:LysR family transcriptional regulator n=1 Tax=Halobacillus sp. A5 TaxID=2880263 RepID=UPI0020A62724|nr:LysR family transcriptional regulator [Halobacillus sp. A5]MCP3029336.1 LysR family transcriptional regulator [Halobacillus sp. A5]